VKTPNIDALAEEGTLYENAYTAAVLCTPSRTCFFSGKYASTTKRYFNGGKNLIDPGEFCFIETMKSNGYQIGLSGKNHTFGQDYFERWFDFVEEYSPHGKVQGTITASDKKVKEFRTTSGPPSRLGNMLLEGLIDFPEPFPEEECMTSRIADDAIAFMEQNKNKPFFLHMSFPAPHWPNVVCEPYFSMYMDQLQDIKLPGMDAINWDMHPFSHYVQSQATGFDEYTREERQKVLAIMYGQITFIDKSIGRLMDALKEQGLYDNTLVVFTSDQGCFGGQFGLPSKTKGFYDALIRVPLIVKKPGDKALGRKTPARISNIDVMPTIMEYIGIEYDEKIDGLSFLPVLTGESDKHRSAIVAEVGRPEMPPAPIDKKEYAAYNKRRSAEDGFWFIEYTTRGRCAAIRKDGWKYCYYNGDMEELYHVAADPYEISNLAPFPEYKKRKSVLRKELFAIGFVGIPD
jgi:arylsulfatase A-like enzyme